MNTERHYKRFTTDKLLDYVKQIAKEHAKGKRDNAIVEAEIHSGFGVKFTHILEWYEDRLYEEGTDSVRHRTSAAQFRKDYARTKNWFVYEDPPAVC